MLNQYRRSFQNPKSAKQSMKADLIIFIIITLASGWIGVLIDRILMEQPEGYSAGTGLWLALPLLCAIILRIREKEWKSFGLTLNIKRGWVGYAAGNFIKNIFEEFAWRGYLTPRLLECNLKDWQVYGISGLVWGLWHTAYYMVFLGDEYFTTSSRLETLMLGCFVTITGAVVYVEIYRITKSVWPCVILHAVQNSISAAFVVTGVSVQYEGGAQAVFDPVTGILSIIILVGAGLLIRKKRIVLDNRSILH